MSEPDVKENVGLSDSDNYYIAKTECWNCDGRVVRHIRKGIPRFQVEVPCNTCGCKVRMNGAKA